MPIPDYQIIWRNGPWYAYVNRVPLVPGHVILAYDGETFTGLFPEGYAQAIETVWACVQEWASRYKDDCCNPVLFRVNLRAGVDDPKTAILPVSADEVVAAAEQMWDRIPKLRPTFGGGLFFLGMREDWADRTSEDLKDMVAEDLMEDLADRGILQTAEQMRDIVAEVRCG